MSSSNIATPSATTTSVESYKQSVPTSYNPYIIKHADVNGTVFIAVGTIIISFFFILLIARFWYWLKNRRAAKHGAYWDDYNGHNNQNGYYSNMEKNDNDNPNSIFLNYDSTIFGSEKNSPSDLQSPLHYNSNSDFSTPSSNNTSSSNNSLRNSINSANLLNFNTPPKPGRMLRGALNQHPQINRNRNSFISPINELILQNENYQNGSSSTLADNSYLSTQNSSPMYSSDESYKTKKRKTQSISFLINASPEINENKSSSNNSSNNSHTRSTSLDIYQLEKMINKSLVEVNFSDDRLNSPATTNKSENQQKGKKRPPSMVLDMLVGDDMV